MFFELRIARQSLNAYMPMLLNIIDLYVFLKYKKSVCLFFMFILSFHTQMKRDQIFLI
jgi:hypothetical protein